VTGEDLHEAMPPEVRAILAGVAEIGEFFRVESAPARPASAQDVVPLADLYAGDPALLDQIRVATDRLGSTELRVGGSILFQGLVARLWSPVVATALTYDRVLTLPPATTIWHPDVAGGRLQVTAHVGVARLDEGDGAGDGVGDAVDDHDRAEGVAGSVVDLHVVPLMAAVQAWVRLPSGLLWGNAASALVGSVAEFVRARPEHGAPAWRLLRALLAHDPLAGGGTLAEAPVATGGAPTGFLRASCCLYYRVPGGTLCGDCPLSSTAVRR
jgi:FhuF 2Fe-2S C-terminal domain